MNASLGQPRRGEQEALVRQVQAAFPFEPLPEMTLAGARADDATAPATTDADDWTDAATLPPSPDWLEPGTIEPANAWPDLAEQHLLDAGDAPLVLDGPAFVYYLPAFLVFVVRHLDDAATLKRGAMMLAQALSTVTDLGARNLASYAQLDRLQRAAVVAVLRHVAARSVIHGPEAQRALQRYWAHAH